MSQSTKVSFSKKAVREHVFGLVDGSLDNSACSLHLEHRANHVKTEFEDPFPLLTYSREAFTFLVTDTISESELKEELGDDFEDSEFVQSYLEDAAYELGKNIDFSSCKLDTDSSKPLYLSRLGSSDECYKIQDTYFIRSEVCFELRGSEYGIAFNELDLRQFITRKYDTPEDYKPLEDKKGASDFDVVCTAFEGDLERIWHDGKIDYMLFMNYLHFKFLSLVFDVKVNPFFERDGLIHQKCKGYGEINYEFAIPEQLINLNRTLKDLKIARKYRDTEWLNS